MNNQQLIDEILTRGVENIYPDKESLKKILMSGKKIRIYVGFDPTAPSLHLGHTISVRKLAQFQKLGHEVIFLIGDFTAMIGDPTDKMAARKQLTKDEVLKNCKDYKKQVSNLIDFGGKNAAKLMYNSEWLAKLKFEDVLKLASNYTVQKMIKREMFDKRIKEDKPIYIHEFLYPLMQGYDSVAMDVDLEIGGNDQTFNMLVGRDLMKSLKNKEKFVMSLKLLVGPTGAKAGKTEGGVINLTDTSEDMFGKIMAYPDEFIAPAFEILTDIEMPEIKKISEAIKNGANPRDYKLKLAYEAIKIQKGEKEAKKAQEEFIKVFSEKGKPTEVESLKLKVKSMNLVDLLMETKLAPSRSEARRLIVQGGVKIDDIKKTDPNEVIEIKKEMILQVGPRHFLRIAADKRG